MFWLSNSRCMLHAVYGNRAHHELQQVHQVDHVLTSVNPLLTLTVWRRWRFYRRAAAVAQLTDRQVDSVIEVVNPGRNSSIRAVASRLQHDVTAAERRKFAAACRLVRRRGYPLLL
jgi:uncharacterized protein (DUF3084 family)